MILSKSFIPLPIGLAGFGFYVPSIIYFVDTGRKYNSAIENKKFGFNFE
jgi:hypothetical protein